MKLSCRRLPAPCTKVQKYVFIASYNQVSQKNVIALALYSNTYLK